MVNKKELLGICMKCGNRMDEERKRCPKCFTKNAGYVVPSKDRCGNCRTYMQPDEKYCKVCGTAAGQGKYEPYLKEHDFECIYGPMPIDREHTCKSCGYKWTTCVMLDRQKYCPKCGGSAPYVELEEMN